MLSTTEQSLERLFMEAVADKCSPADCAADSAAAVIERVKKIRDYAFIHFRDRQLALVAMQRLNGLLSDFALLWNLVTVEKINTVVKLWTIND